MASASLKHIARQELARRSLPGGGIADQVRGRFRTDATGWGILTLCAAGVEHGLIETHRARLVREQDENGRICMDSQHPESYWPTTLAILAWQSSLPSRSAQDHAVQFLLEAAGNQYPRKPDDPWAHDTTLRGWPWIQATHSWVEPTALAVIALKAAGHAQHGRVHEAIRMIVDRQLPHGGWNYGNTLVFGRELHPMPESTGAALAGLAQVAGKDQVARSLVYLEGEVDRLRTPISLGWSLLGLAAWNRRPSNTTALVERCLKYQSRYGEYETSALCLLLLGALTNDRETGTTALLSCASEPRGLSSLSH